MIKKKQFKGFSFWGFKDLYEFPIPSMNQDIINKISEFYLAHKAKPVLGDEILFIRGNKFWTWFNFWSELWPYQTIQVNVNDHIVTVKYKILGGMWLRFPPYHLEKEIVELQKILNET